jgi:ribosomal protein L5
VSASAARDAKLIDGAVRDLATITGQKPQVRQATKSIAQFKLREDMPIGAKVTLRGGRMWEFLDRLLTIALPRIRDFRGLSPTVRRPGQLHVRSHGASMFHEINPDSIDRPRGMTSPSSRRRQRTRRAGRCCAVWASRSGGVRWPRRPYSSRPRPPKFKVRGYTVARSAGDPARCCVQAVPHLRPADGAPRRVPGVSKSSW